MMLDLLTLAAAAAPDPQISGAWVLELVAKIFVGIAVLIGAAWAAWKKAEARFRPKGDVTIQAPIPPITVFSASGPVTLDQHNALAKRVERVEAEVKEIRIEVGKQYAQILEAGHERELRIMQKIDASARAQHARLDELFGKRPPATRK